MWSSRTSARGFLVPFLLAAAFLFGFALGWTRGAPEQAAGVVARTSPAVVVITTKHILGRSVRGMGFLYNPAGFILTNHHIVEGAVSITVTLADGRSFPAAVVDFVHREEYVSPQERSIIDVAVLKIRASRLPTLPLGDSAKLTLGQEVFIFRPTAPGAAIRSTRGSIIRVQQEWINTEPEVTPNASGGPVLDRRGQGVGLATFVGDPFGAETGAIPIRAVRDVATSALNPRAVRAQRVRVTGMAYLAPVRLGRSQLWQVRFDPGETAGKASVRRYSTNVTQLQNFTGAILYTVRTSTGGKSTNYIDSHGLYALTETNGAVTTFYPQPALSWPFPLVAGRTWRYTWHSEDSARKNTSQATVTVHIENVDEIVTVPAGKFAQVVRIRYIEQGTRTQGKRTATWRIVRTEWVAPRLGTIQVVSDNLITKERTVSQILRSN